MPNKNISQYNLLTAVETGDFLILWDSSQGATYKVYANDIVGLDAINNDEWFNNIYVRNRGRISGVIGGETGVNLLTGDFPGILAGQSQRAVGNNTAVLAGQTNLSSGVGSVVAGNANQAFGTYSIVLGGNDNVSVSANTAILVSDTSRINGELADGSVILGGIFNVITGTSSYSIIAGGQSNRLMANRAAIIAGQTNINSGADSAILAGSSNQIVEGSIDHSAIIAGTNNVISGDSTYSTIVGGQGHRLMASESAVIGGANAKVSGADAVVIGGENCVVSGIRSVVIGGNAGQAFGANSVTIGGINAKALGVNSIAAGQNAEARLNGSVIFADNTSATKVSYGQDSFTLNFSGGVWITGGGLNTRLGFNIYPTGDAPTSSTPGRSGDIAYKDDFVYIKTGEIDGQWGRVQLSTLDNTPPSVVSNDSSMITGGGTGFVLNNDTYLPISFEFNSPIISLPAGNGTYLIDCVAGVERGSDTPTTHLVLRNNTDSKYITDPGFNPTINGGGTNRSYYALRSILSVTETKTIQLYAGYSGFADSLAEHPLLVSTGTYISYIKLA
ncbi:MAG: hypothetical protein Q8O88_03455 [bacterium]|nr:hypothetical protein [bacterium]